MGTDDNPYVRVMDGEILVIDDQMRSYVTYEDDEFVVRRVDYRKDNEAKACGGKPKWDEEKRYERLIDALLSLMDFSWQEPGDKVQSKSVETP